MEVWRKTEIKCFKFITKSINCIGICIGTDGAQVLSELLKNNTTLTVLKMDSRMILIKRQNYILIGVLNIDNMIGTKGIVSLSSVLMENTTLVELSFNGLWDFFLDHSKKKIKKQGLQ